MTLNEWIVKGEVGISSKTMWAAITGAVTTGDKGWKFDVPHDPDDFRRCLKFVTDCGIDDEQMLLVKNVFPWFAPFIDNWGKMLKLWIEESPKGRCPKLYDYMQDLENQSMILTGFVRDGKRSWEKEWKRLADISQAKRELYALTVKAHTYKTQSEPQNERGENER